MKKYDLELINCPLCHSASYSIYIKNAKELYNNLDEYFNVCRCNQCEHFFTNPRPTIKSIAYFYPDNAGYYNPSTYIEPKGFQYRVYKQILNVLYGYQLQTDVSTVVAYSVYFFKQRQIKVSHLPEFIEDGKLLDIGCSYGNYLKKMQTLGWKHLYGTEINENAVTYACEKLHLNNVQKSFFEESDFSRDFFDVVNMNMVLEHVFNPNITMQKVNKILKPNGQLMISVPDISGFESRFYKQYFYGLQVPEHLHHFSPKTITELLEKHGFIVEKIVHQNFDRDFVASSGYMKNKLLSKVLSNKIIRKTFVKLFVFILANMGKTSRMSIYARKIS